MPHTTLPCLDLVLRINHHLSYQASSLFLLNPFAECRFDGVLQGTDHIAKMSRCVQYVLVFVLSLSHMCITIHAFNPHLMHKFTFHKYDVFCNLT